MKRVVEMIEKIEPPSWVIWVCFGVLILRIPSFFEPYSYGDEMIYLALGNGLRQGLTLYKDIFDNKPPLLYLLAGLAGNLFWFKVILATWNVATIAIFAKLLEKLFPNNGKLQKVTVIIFAIFSTIPLLEGNIVNAELFMIGPIILGFLLLLAYNNTPTLLVVSGIVFAIGALFKIPATFDIPAIVFYWLIKDGLNRVNITNVFRKTSLLILGFSIPFILSFIWYALRGALNDYISAAYLSNIGYISSWRSTSGSFLTRNGPLLVRGLIVIIGTICVYFVRRKLSKEFIFITLWLLFSLFGVTLSERPYPHYLIQSLPAMSIFIGYLLANRTIEQSLAIIPLTLAFAVPVVYKFWYYPPLSYYPRFIQLSLGKISQEGYLASFGNNVNINYKTSKLIAEITRPEDRVFVLGDSPSIYALSRRLPPIKFVADYHIHDYSNLDKELNNVIQKRPEVIVVLQGSSSPSFFTRFIYSNYVLMSDENGTYVWKIRRQS